MGLQANLGRRRSGLAVLEQVPAIAVKVLEHRDLAIGLVGGRADEAYTGCGEGGEVAFEIIGGEEQEDPPRRLVADRRFLFGCDRASEEEGSSVLRRAGRADRHPALVLLGLVCVLDQREAELADVEGEGLVIVSDDQGDVG